MECKKITSLYMLGFIIMQIIKCSCIHVFSYDKFYLHVYSLNNIKQKNHSNSFHKNYNCKLSLATIS